MFFFFFWVTDLLVAVHGVDFGFVLIVGVMKIKIIKFYSLDKTYEEVGKYNNFEIHAQQTLVHRMCVSVWERHEA